MNFFCKAVFLFIIIFSKFSFAQIVASDDVYLCESTEVVLEATANGTDGTNTGISSDDTFGGVINIGFNFDFYGNTYNQCVISSNNYLSFDIGNANGYSGWNIGAAVPNNFDAPLNAILCPWQDINPGIGGNIQYSLSGVAPNRVFTVTFCAIPMFSCTDICYTSQIKLFETTNIIETHISEKPLCATWNGGAAIHALHNNNGTIANVVTGPDGVIRNFPNQWTALEDGYRFTPNGNNDYIIDQIEYQPVITGNTVTWLDIDGNIIGSGNTITVNPTESTTYFAQAQLCEGGGCAGFGGGTVEDSVNIFFENISVNYETVPASCGWESEPDGQITSNPTGTGPFDFIWTNEAGILVQETLSQNSDTLENIPPGTYFLNVSTPQGCLDEAIIVVEMDGVMPEDADAGADLVICSNSTNLSATSPVTFDNFGEWELVSGSGLISDINNPNSSVSNLSIGENIFQWNVINECGVNSDQITLTVLDGNPVITELLNPTPCSFSTSFSASLEGDVIIWSGAGPGNINFSSPNNLSTDVTVDQYGTYNFTITGCSGSENFTVDFSTASPEILDPDPIYCELQTNLQLSQNNLELFDLQNSTGWTVFSSPNSSTVLFDSPNNFSTNVLVDQYGTYQFMFETCNSSDIVTVEFLTAAPEIQEVETVYCDFQANLELTQNNLDLINVENSNGWSLFSSPPGSSVYLETPDNPSTNVVVDQYGTYQFMFETCNSSDLVSVVFSPDEPFIVAPSHLDCSLNADLIVYTEAESGGPWTQIDGPYDATFSDLWSPQTEVTVPNYGIYTFQYSACDIIQTVSVGFSCELILPNIFTPNGDGINDEFAVEGLTADVYSNSLLTIFNRWGSVVYVKSNYGLDFGKNWWDGEVIFDSYIRDYSENQESTYIEDGIYYYVLDVYNEAHKQKEVYKGYVTILKD